MLTKLREIGVTSDMLYAAGVASIGISLLTWVVSKKADDPGTSRPEDRSLFIGEWPPTFFILGTALRIEEQREKK